MSEDCTRTPSLFFIPGFCCARRVVSYFETGDRFPEPTFGNPLGLMVAATVLGRGYIGVCLGFRDGLDSDVGTNYMIAYSNNTIVYMCLECLMHRRAEYLLTERPSMTVILVDRSPPKEFFRDKGYARDDLGNISVKYRTCVTPGLFFPRSLSVAKVVTEGVVVGMCVGKILTACIPQFLVVFADNERGEYSAVELELMRRLFEAGSRSLGLEPIAVSI